MVYSHCMGTETVLVQEPNRKCSMYKCLPWSETGTETRMHCFLLCQSSSLYRSQSHSRALWISLYRSTIIFYFQHLKHLKQDVFLSQDHKCHVMAKIDLPKCIYSWLEECLFFRYCRKERVWTRMQRTTARAIWPEDEPNRVLRCRTEVNGEIDASAHSWCWQEIRGCWNKYE